MPIERVTSGFLHLVTGTTTTSPVDRMIAVNHFGPRKILRKACPGRGKLASKALKAKVNFP
jgi:hypothetical protein